MNVLLLLSHSIAEYDDVRMFSDMGVDVFSIGAYSDPSHPGDVLRPAVPGAPDHPELRQLVIQQREAHAGEDESWAIDWAKADLHPDLIAWADVIICHHYLDRWIVPQWDKIRHKRVIWRTCGQSDPNLEWLMARLRQQGLEIVRYSPKESAIPNYAGQDALIRFGKYPSDFLPWTGDLTVVGNVTQWRGSSGPLARGDAVGLTFWQNATADLPTRPAGPGSEALPGGLGTLPPSAMTDYLSHLRTYLYLGTVPAPYTLGLIEAMMAGVPVLSIRPEHWFGPTELFEGHDLTTSILGGTAEYAAHLRALLNDHEMARISGMERRDTAIMLFGVDRIMKLWAQFLDLGEYMTTTEIARRIGAVS